MEDKERKVPKLRFPGFTGDWEQRKVGDLLEERKELQVETKEFPLMAFIGNKGVAPKGERYDRSALINDAETKLYKKTYYGDFIYSSNNLETGSIGINYYGKACISPVYSIFKATEITDYNFIGYQFTQKRFIAKMIKWRQGVIYGQWRIHESDFFKIDTLLPNIKEQKEIGQFLKRIDENIALHQRKLDDTKKLKNALLQKMFPKEGSNVPELRFPGCTGAWEQRKLGEIAERVQGNDGRLDLPTLTISASKGWLDQKERFSTNIAGKELKNYTLLEKGQLSYNHGNSKYAKYGAVFVLHGLNEALVPRVYHSFKVLPSTIPDFIEYYFSTGKLDRELGKKITSGARMDGLLNISFSEFMDINLMVPKKEEQKEIVSILYSINNIITLHQRKLDNMKKLKQSIMEP